MKVEKLTQVLKRLNGKALLDDEEKELTLKSTMTNALLAQTESEKDLSGVEKVKRYKLATRIYDAKDTIAITVEQAELIRSQIAKVYTPLIVGQVWELIDPDNDDRAEEKKAKEAEKEPVKEPIKPAEETPEPERK